MQTIYKYPITPKTVLNLPSDYKILTVHAQHNEPYCWIQHNTSFNKGFVEITLVVVTTGEPFDEQDNHTFLGTIFLSQENYVIHIFQSN